MRFQGFRRSAVVVFVLVLVITLVVTWPRVPWPLLQYGAPAAMVLAPIILYPFSKLVWVAFDLSLRPATPNDVSPPRPSR
jgi:hypothetical protein